MVSPQLVYFPLKRKDAVFVPFVKKTMVDYLQWSMFRSMISVIQYYIGAPFYFRAVNVVDISFGKHFPKLPSRCVCTDFQ